MKKVFAMAALAFLGGIAANAQKETLEGNGKKVTREVSVSAFEALKAQGMYELKLAQGDKEAVKIEADENLQDLFIVRNDGNTLVIEMKKMENRNLKVRNNLKVYVTFRKLKEMELKTIGNVESQEQLTFDELKLNNRSVGNVDLRLTANTINVSNSSVGNVKLTGKAQQAVFRNSGVGEFEAGDFVVQDLNIENSGVGSAEVNAEKGLKVKDSGLGKVKNKGAAPKRSMNRVRV